MAVEKKSLDISKYLKKFTAKTEGEESFREESQSTIDLQKIFEVELKNKKEQALIKTIKDNNRTRRRFGELIFALTSLWLLFILMLVMQCARGVFYLSDTVLITLITTSTLNVLGFFTAVTLYLFNKDKST